MMKAIVKKCAIFVTLVAIISNIYIFTYPSLHPQSCSWNCASSKRDYIPIDSLNGVERWLYYAKRYINDVKQQILPSETAEEKGGPSDIHLLALGDPQIKGNWKHTPYITRLDTFGNDYYLGHIYSMMKKRLHPTHVAVMGDLFSSQWIGDSEFFNRTVRYTHRLFKRNTTWLEAIRDENHDEDNQYKVDWVNYADDLQVRRARVPMDFQFGYEDVYSWDPENEDSLFINITGNHDIGYSGDATFQHMARFYELFGKDNYWIEYDNDTDHPWRIVVLNSLLLEGPALQPEFLNITWEFLYQLFERRFAGSTVLLTHVPFYKRAGLCADGPEFRYYPADFEREPYKKNLLRSQNHLSEETTKRVLNLIFDNEKPGIILTGHDHVGCETIYNKDNKSGQWKASKVVESPEHFIKEITVKSMMGEFNGNAGLVTGRFDSKKLRWEWTFTLCPFSIQHVWWFTKVATIISGFLLSLLVLL